MRPRWLWLALAVSVAANLFLAGLWLGGGLAERRAPAFERRGPPLTAMAPEQRPLVQQRLRAAARAGREDVRAARQGRRRAAALVAADPYDRVAAESALADSRAAEGRLRTRTDAALLDVAAELGPADRRALSEIVGRGRLRGGHGRH